MVDEGDSILGAWAQVGGQPVSPVIASAWSRASISI
jgi:hypothetical protein